MQSYLHLLTAILMNVLQNWQIESASSLFPCGPHPHPSRSLKSFALHFTFAAVDMPHISRIAALNDLFNWLSVCCTLYFFNFLAPQHVLLNQLCNTLALPACPYHARPSFSVSACRSQLLWHYQSKAVTLPSSLLSRRLNLERVVWFAHVLRHACSSSYSLVNL